MTRLDGKIALITGGSSGIGLAAAKRLVAEGAHVFITGRRQSELGKARDALGDAVSAIQGDVASLDDLDRMVAQIKAEKGVVDIVVANAGFVALQSIDAATPDHFDKTFAINARGTYFTVAKILPLMTRGGSIVILSSCLRQMGIPAFGAYAATKAALRSYARTWAAELKDRNIRVNSVSPGPIDTPILDSQYETREEADGGRAASAGMNPMGRIGTPEEVANAIYYLASDESSYSTGTDIVVDGGVTQI